MGASGSNHTALAIIEAHLSTSRSLLLKPLHRSLQFRRKEFNSDDIIDIGKSVLKTK